MNLNTFKSIYPLVKDLYGISLDSNSFEDIAFNGWQLIGNRITNLHKYTAGTVDRKLHLPCNVDLIEGVFSQYTDYQESTPQTPFTNYEWIESYAENSRNHKSSFYHKGGLVNYRQEGEYLVFDRDYPSITVLYHGVVTDDEGWPLITDKEVQALAAYCAYVDTYKRSLTLKDGGLMQMAAVLKQDWLRFCNSSRIPTMLTQNDLNNVLEVKNRWDRKSYGHSFKPIR